MMKNGKKVKLWKMLGLTLAMSVVGFAAACASDDSSSSSPSDSLINSGSSEILSSLTMNKTAVTLDLLEEVVLVATQENLTGEIVWTTSDSTVATVTDGMVKGLKEGSVTITATCGDYMATCAVTVAASGVRPVLMVDGADETVNILTGRTFELHPTFKYNGNILTDATFTYATQSTAITVSNDGTITGVAAGTATVTVTATWGSFTEYAVVNVSVVSDSAVLSDVAEITLYSSAITGELAAKTPVITVRVDGQTVNNPTLEYEYDNTLISVSATGEVKNIATSNTTTTLTVKYEVDDTTTLSTPITINLRYVEIDKTAECDDYRFVATNENLASAFASCFEDGSAVIKVFDSADKETNLMNAEGNLVFKASHFGEREWVVYGDKGYACVVKGLLVTAEISTAEQFKNYFVMQNVNSSTNATSSKNPEETYYDGYFVLTADLDLGGAYFLNKYPNYDAGNYPIPAEGAGFNGVFDGQGHTISNFTVYSNGASVFATVGTKGVIKNLGIIANSACRWANGVVANTVFGKLENVFVAIDNSNFTDFYGNNFGAVCYATGGDAEFVNVVTYMGGFVQNGYSANTNSFVNWAYGGTFKNCYAVYGANVKTTAKDGVTSYSMDEYQTSTYDYTGYDSNIWDIQNGLPVMKSALSAMQGKITTSAGEIVEYDDEISVTCSSKDNYYTLTASGGTFTDKGNGDYVLVAGESLAGGTVTVTLYLFGREVETLAVDIARKSQTQALDGVVTYKQYNWNGSAYVLNSEDLVFDMGVATVNEATFFVTNHAGVTTGIDATVENGVITVSADTLASIAGSEYTFNVMVSAGSYDIKYTKKFDLVTKEISTKAQFTSIFLMSGTNAGNGSSVAKETYYDGLYRLTANITIDGKNKVPYYTGTDTGAADFGFNGILDGQGFVATDTAVNSNPGSILGTLGRNGVVKNMAFLSCDICWWTNGIVAGDVYGTIDNVLVEMDDPSSKWASPNNFGALCSSSKVGAVISNCVTKYLNYGSEDATYSKNAASFIRFEDGATLVNNYTVYGGSDGSEGKVTYAIGRAYNGKTYTAEEIVAITPSQVATTTFSGLNESIWNVTAGQLPSFKKA